MNALIKKEIRLILPAWIAAMLLVILPIWIIPANLGSYRIYAFALGFLFLGLASFGQEFSFRTLSLSLSQPVSRHRFWLIKITTLIVAMVFVLLALVVSAEIQNDFSNRSFFVPPLGPVIGTLLIASVACSGGLWATLLLRQVTGAFWFALLVPVIILILFGGFSEHFQFTDATEEILGVVIFVIYSIAGFFWARHLFLNAQDAQWTGGDISFPWHKKISEQTSTANQPRHWLSALARKEFQLHQANILIAALVLALHLAAVVIRKVHPNFENPNVKFILDATWALWLLMPLLIGSAAVAEERRLGIIESQLCLPASRRAQLFIKFSVALILSLILGGLMPLLIERTKDLDFHIYYVAAAIFFISFYASTLACTTLQAIGLAIPVAVAIYLYEVATAIRIFKFGYDSTSAQFGVELLKLYLGVPILLFTFGWLTFRNFKWLHENWKLWRRNFIVVLAAFATIFVLSNAIYLRAWEFLTPADKPHGLARLSESEPPKLLNSLNAVSVLFSDGRLWSERTDFSDYERIVPRLDTQQFVDGSNWTDAASDGLRVVAIKSDGSLWSFQTYGGWRGMPLYPLTQIGSEKNWSRVAGSGGFLLLKKDGTLWTWGVDGKNVDSTSDKLRKYLATQPQRLDEGTNWTDVFSYGRHSGSFARKTDGSIWVREWQTNSMFYMAQARLPRWVSAASTYEWNALINTNGELWLTCLRENQKPNNFQIGQNEKWKAVAFVNGNSLIALRNDGTLWKWSNLWNLIQNSDAVKPSRLGNHSDWIALSTFDYQNSVALAADGSLWIWDAPSGHAWLVPSRKPIFIGNIFEGGNPKAE